MRAAQLLTVGFGLLLAGVAIYALTRAGGGDAPQPDPLPIPSAPPSFMAPSLPQNHPPIGSASAALPRLADMRDERPEIEWKLPAGWSLGTGSAMRLATYRLPAADGAPDEAEVSVMRAGGDVDSNVHRWVGQFDEAGQDTRVEKTVAGFKVTIVEVSGTYLGNAMGPNDALAKKGWSLLGAIVETSGSAYFFKMTGPTATVKKAHDPFVAMIEGITKV